MPQFPYKHLLCVCSIDDNHNFMLLNLAWKKYRTPAVHVNIICAHTQTQTFKHLMQLPCTAHTRGTFVFGLSTHARWFRSVPKVSCAWWMMSAKPHECDDFWIVPARIDDATWCQRRKSNSLNETRNHACVLYYTREYYMYVFSANLKLCELCVCA